MNRKPPPHQAISSAAPQAVGRTATAADWVAATGQGYVHTLAPPVVVERPRFDHTGFGQLASVRKVERFVSPAAHVVELPNARVWGPDGTVLTTDGCVVEDLIRGWGQAAENHPIWTAPSHPPCEVSGTAAVVAARGAATNFSHFLADTLPRIQLVRDTGIEIDTWIVSSHDYRWQREGLELAGIPADRTIALTDTPWISAGTLIVPSRTGFAPTTAPWARERLITLLAPGSRPRKRKILVSRQHASRRRLLNADDLIDHLEPHGFEHVDFDTMPLAEQVRTVHECQTVVAVHGAALGHLLHAPRAGHVIEIANPNAIHPEYWGIAAQAGWTHNLIDAQPAFSDCRDDELHKDLTVDIGEVHRSIERASSQGVA